MAHAITRRQLLKADPTGRQFPLHPPWAGTGFLQHCDRCMDCLPACPEQVIIAADGGFPGVDFDRGECTFCGDCVTACKPGALLRPTPATPAWSCVAAVGPGCLELAGVHCHACIDPCPELAIRIPAGPAGRRLPLVDADRCSGCGACVAPCPTRAIRIAPPAVTKEQAA